MPSMKPRKVLSALPVTFAALTGTLLAAVILPGIVHSEEAKPAAPPASPEAVAYFETNIRPVLANNCYSCHGKDAQLGGLRVDSLEALLKGGDSGPALVPGDPTKSLLITAVEHTGKVKMPQGGKLKDNEIAALRDWVKMGAPWGAATTPAGAAKPKTIAPLWSLQPITNPKPPPVKNAVWCNTVMDRFILAKLEAKNLTPAPEADKRTLLRRVTYDLTGLPPTLAETTAFLADKRPDTYARVVDRLLASPHYGERMARLWLDIARYSDTKGYVFAEDRNYPNAYTYRDWVINAFNADMPYSDFVVRQIAADRLPHSSGASDLAALGFLTVGRRFLNSTPDIMDDRIDVTMRGIEGFTVACARCHDHKFDPIPTQDYYSLYAIFNASKEASPEISKQPVKVAMAMEDVEKPGEQRIFKRGNPGNPGDVAPRRFLLALSPKDKPRPEWTNGSGRLELARAMTDKQNPLTARVFVNRVWRWHFGNGIVRTPSDFGHQGEKPTHPELLDYLATQFMSDGWSIKKLHRRILLSAAYRQSSRYDKTSFTTDPENRLLWRQNRRRLDLEQTRDALLAASGNLNLKDVGGPSEDMWKAPFMTRRALYGKVERQNLPATFRTFDFASPDSTNAGRFTTTVPQQALFFMNAPLVIEQARTLAALPEVTKAPDTAGQVRALYRRLFDRSPLPDELTLGVRFLGTHPDQPASGDALQPVWQYGYGSWKNNEVESFTPFPYFAGVAYRMADKTPDDKLGYANLSAQGGHPGKNDTQSVIRRFIAPRDMVVSVAGTLRHQQKEGDGVYAALYSSRAGLLGQWKALNSQVDTPASKIQLKKGDTLDFVLSPGPGGDGYDSFLWAPELTAAGATRAEWSAQNNFEAPLPAPLTRREQYAQALLMTNEFVFVD